MAANDNFNLLGLQANLDESFNTDNSVDNSTDDRGRARRLAERQLGQLDQPRHRGLGQHRNSVQRHRTVEVEVEVEDSFNDNSDNSRRTTRTTTNPTTRSNDSYNDNSDHYKDSFNTTTLIDNSVTAGVRQYNAGIGDMTSAALAAAVARAGGGGDTDIDIDNRPTIVDQSVNQNI